MSLSSSAYREGHDFQTVRRRKARRKAVTAIRAANTEQFKGAPEPSRDIFVYRVMKDTPQAEIEKYITDNNINIRSIDKVSNIFARYDSFKVVLKLSDMETVLNSEFWPEGVSARRYFNPRKNNDS